LAQLSGKHNTPHVIPIYTFRKTRIYFSQLKSMGEVRSPRVPLLKRVTQWLVFRVYLNKTTSHMAKGKSPAKKQAKKPAKKGK